MSFCREVLDNVISTNVEITRPCLVKIHDEIVNYENKIMSYIDQNFSDFLPSINITEVYLKEGEKLDNDTQSLLKHASTTYKMQARENLKQSIVQVQNRLQGMHVAVLMLNIMNLLDDLKKPKLTPEQATNITIINEMKSLLKKNKDLISGLRCYKNIRLTVSLEEEKLRYELKNSFESMVQLFDKTFNNTKLITIKIIRDKKHLNDVLIALIATKYNPKILCKFLLDNIFGPIMTRPVALRNLPDDKAEDGFNVLELSYHSANVNDYLRPPYKMVFKNIVIAITFLKHLNTADTEDVLISMIAAQIKDDFCTSLITEMLQNAVPETIVEMEKSTLSQDIKVLILFLQQSKFLKEEDTKLEEFISSIELLFRKRFCAQIINNATTIMKKNLHDISVADSNNIPDIEKFPNCMISSSMFELISLLENTDNECKNSDEETAEKLKFSIKSIFELYLTNMAFYHERNLNQVPQISAIFYNNSIYLAHWSRKLILKSNVDYLILPSSLQSTGEEIFERQLNIQRNQLREMMNDIDLLKHNKILLTPMLNKIGRQLILLKNVWQSVLPPAKYNSSIGSLLNGVLKYLIDTICSLEDISTEMSMALDEFMGQLIQKSKELFENSEECIIHVPLWTKFTQLQMMMTASLAEINDKWAERKGPLTLNYTPTEIRSIIRALFQNTKRRANILQSI